MGWPDPATVNPMWAECAANQVANMRTGFLLTLCAVGAVAAADPAFCAPNVAPIPLVSTPGLTLVQAQVIINNADHLQSDLVMVGGLRVGGRVRFGSLGATIKGGGRPACPAPLPLLAGPACTHRCASWSLWEGGVRWLRGALWGLFALRFRFSPASCFFRWLGRSLMVSSLCVFALCIPSSLLLPPPPLPFPRRAPAGRPASTLPIPTSAHSSGSWLWARGAVRGAGFW